jgi:hypothetical protein
MSISGGSLNWCPIFAIPDQWQCAARGWVRNSGRIPVPQNSKQRVHYLKPGQEYAVIALPNETLYTDKIYPQIVALFGDDLAPDVPRPSVLTPGLEDALAELTAYLDRGVVDISPLGVRASRYHTPENRYGSRRFRPTRVRDDMGRELTFQYYGRESTDNAGLLRQVRGPSGVTLTFEYNAPQSHPHRLDERFLTGVERRVSPVGELSPVCPDGCSQAGQPIRHEYIYNWRNPDTEDGYWKHDVELWARLAATYRPPAPANPSGLLPEDTPTQTPPAPDLSTYASLEALRYIETQADNITRVIRSRWSGEDWIRSAVELETRYGVRPDEPDQMDRVLAQRYGVAENQASLGL